MHSRREPRGGPGPRRCAETPAGGAAGGGRAWSPGLAALAAAPTSAHELRAGEGASYDPLGFLARLLPPPAFAVVPGPEEPLGGRAEARSRGSRRRRRRPPARLPRVPAAIMLALISRLLDWFRSLFWKEEMELTLVGLQYSGKTTFVNVIAVSACPLAAGGRVGDPPRGGAGRTRWCPPPPPRTGLAASLVPAAAVVVVAAGARGG